MSYYKATVKLISKANRKDYDYQTILMICEQEPNDYEIKNRAYKLFGDYWRVDKVSTPVCEISKAEFEKAGDMA